MHSDNDMDKRFGATDCRMYVWALIWYKIGAEIHKLNMNIERVVSNILDSDLDSDWNKLDKESK